MREHSQSDRSKARTLEAKVTIAGLVFAVLAATAHGYQLIIEWRFLGRATELGILTSSSFALLQLFFVLSFLTYAVGLLMHNLPRLIISILGLSGALFGYIYWFSYSSRWLKGIRTDMFYAEHPEFVPPHLLGLIGARWWDIVILTLTAVLLILALRALMRSRRTSS